MPKFRHWVRTKLRGNRPTGVEDDSTASKVATASGSPFLPAQRPRSLTPSSSQESLLPNLNTQNAFFKGIPFELRQQIYAAAFGERIVHIDLNYDHPAISVLANDAHAGIDPDDRRDRSVPAAWVWWSCVCHRNPLLEAYDDECRRGSSYHTTCFLYPGEMPGKCFVGAMGWLLTCRQAYAEGLNVLYKTNTFHIRNEYLTREFHRLLLPRRLALITALELSWRTFESLSDYQSSFQTIIVNFPSLRRLYLFIEVDSYFFVQGKDKISKTTIIESYESNLLAPVDEMVIKLGPKLQNCQIAPQRSYYGALKARAESAGARVEKGGGNKECLRWERFWRPVQPEKYSLQPTDASLGYWIRPGRDDVYIPGNCFGT